MFPAADPLASNEGSLLTTVFVVLVLLLLYLLLGKMYRKYSTSFFEVISFANLMLFAVLSLYFESTSGKQEIAVYISGGVFLSCFIFVLMYQCYLLQKQNFTCGKKQDPYHPIDEGELPDLIDDNRC